MKNGTSRREFVKTVVAASLVGVSVSAEEARRNPDGAAQAEKSDTAGKQPSTRKAATAEEGSKVTVDSARPLRVQA